MNLFLYASLKLNKTIQIGKNPNLMSPCYLSAINGNIKIGNNISCNRNVTVDASEKGYIEIGDNVLIGQNTVIRSSNHIFDKLSIPINLQGHKTGKIIIGNDIWIGANSVILPDVTIGSHTIIGAGSIVTKSLPESVIAVGNPAKIIRSRL
jgi:galactoside O-acetyltransferase